MDGRIGTRMYDDEFQGFPVDLDNAFLVNLPVAHVRIGPYLSDKAQIEPSVGFELVSLEGETAYQLDLGLDLLLYLGDDPSRSVPFVRLGPGVLLLNDGDESASQFQLGGGFGVRIPAGDRLAVRLQAAVDRNFSNDDFLGSWDLGVMFGLSFFTR